MKRSITALIGCMICILAALPMHKAQAAEAGNLIQMAILLDTSSSMDGLIDQAKTQLWKIVNEMARAKKNGQSPMLEVALVEYGNSGLSAEQGYIRMVAPLTTDLDRISEALFKLTTNGGDEYCGQVIQSAVTKLKWSDKSDILKMIFIAGNEPFTQGRIYYKEACKAAIAKGIVVNTIFCGDSREGERSNWKDGALLADGRYMSINQNQEIVHIQAPQDAEIIRLGEALNKTYVSYGAEGEKNMARQSEQDEKAAAAAPQVMVQRSVTKSSKQYSNSSWDLVDAVAAGSVNLATLPAEKLPETMQKMDTQDRKRFVEKMKKEREQIQLQIQKLNDERRKYVTQIRHKRAEENTLDSAMVEAVREQAVKKNYVIE